MWFFYYWRPPFLRRTCIFNLKSEDTIRGVLWQTHGPWFTLRQASLLKAGAKPTPIDGEIVIHRHEINFTQVLP